MNGQEEYLKDCTLKRTPYVRRSERNDHEHCEFCWMKFSEYEGDLREGCVTTANGQEYWICPKCCKDFKRLFGWTVED